MPTPTPDPVRATFCGWPMDGRNMDAEWNHDPRCGTPLVLRTLDARHLEAAVCFSEEEARKLFNWLGIQLHKRSP